MSLSRKQSSMIRQAVLETVEERRMFAVTATLSSGVLTITGTSAADDIVVYKDVANLKVKKDATHTSTFAYASVTKIVANLGSGADKFTSDNSVGIKMAVNGGNDNDTITTGAGNDTVHGDAGKDKISGMDNSDVLYGDSGNDTVNGNGGLDIIYDNAGADNHFGGTGNDYFIVDLVNTTESDLFDGGDGTDWISYSGRPQAVRIQPDGVANDGRGDGTHGPGLELDNVFGNIEILIGTAYGDGIYLSETRSYNVDGGGGGDYIVGAGGNETLGGGSGDDFIFGEGGNDSMTGGSGKDSMDGGSGNDTMNGGSDKDSMYGQGGNDKIYAKDGIFNEIVNGGSGTDWAQVDGFDLPFGADVYFDILTSIETKVL